LNSLGTVWQRLDGRRRAAVIAATLAMLAAIALLARGPGRGEMALLYAGLDAAAAGEVVAALQSRGTPFEMRGDAVWVPAAARDLERVALAAEGLPAPSARGYELLDSLSGFGTTAQMFDAAYWRAREGELARTILAVPRVRAVRVHIAAGQARPFRAGGAPTAAVTVTLAGGPLAPAQAQALRHLVAAAVPGLDPSAVAVIDAAAGLVPDAAAADAVPDSRAEALRERALRLVEARVGPGNAVVEVAVETVTESERLTERRLDPESRVAISTETEESESASSGAGGAVTVASNLPEGDAAGGEGPRSEETTSRTRTNFELSETSREVVRTPGAVRRLTVAVLVNDLPGEGGASMPRPAEELAALSDLVASAVGLDAGRGDVITVRSMPFEPLAALGSEPTAAAGAPFDMAGLVRPLLLALVALGLGLFVLRPLLRAPAPAALPALAPPAPALTGAAAPAAAPALAPPSGGEAPPDPAQRLRRLIEARQAESARLLQSWIEAPARGEEA
jgi:flagellar M-ring protein FliF